MAKAFTGYGENSPQTEIIKIELSDKDLYLRGLTYSKSVLLANPTAIATLVDVPQGYVFLLTSCWIQPSINVTGTPVQYSISPISRALPSNLNAYGDEILITKGQGTSGVWGDNAILTFAKPLVFRSGQSLYFYANTTYNPLAFAGITGYMINTDEFFK